MCTPPDAALFAHPLSHTFNRQADHGLGFLHAFEPAVKLQDSTFVELRSRHTVDPVDAVQSLKEMKQTHSIGVVEVALLDFHGGCGHLLGWNHEPVASLLSLIVSLQEMSVRVIIFALCDGEQSGFPKDMACDVLYFYGAVPVVDKTRLSVALVAAAAALQKHEVSGKAMHDKLSYHDKRLVGLRSAVKGH
jgi:hypothetical protein